MRIPTVQKVRKENFERGNWPEGTPKIEYSKKIEGRLPLKFFGLGYDVGKKILLKVYR